MRGGKRFVVGADEKMTAFFEIGSGDCKPAPQTVLNNQSLRFAAWGAFCFAHSLPIVHSL
jgi:hypothetical protein